jgi:phosphatidate cytidylyltransferase
MLKQRVITAVVLLALLLPALFAPVAWPFELLTLVAAAAAGWEWARLNSGRPNTALLLGVIVAAACAAALWLGWPQDPPRKLWWTGTAVWVLGGSLALWAGVAGWPKAPVALRWLIGAWSLWLAWLALVNARAQGINFLLSLLCLVWAADIAAYFGGRAFGRHKLAPNISPGKTWEGVWSGMLGVFALAFAWLAVEGHAKVDSPSLYVQLRDTFGLPPMVLALLVLSAISVVGDLVESLVKRAAGAKDSSGLLPGHGGVLDRIDALLPVFPLAMALVSI